MTYLGSLETLGSPLEFEIKLFGFEQCLTAQHEFEMPGRCLLKGLNVIASHIFIPSVTLLKRTDMLQALFPMVFFYLSYNLL